MALPNLYAISLEVTSNFYLRLPVILLDATCAILDATCGIFEATCGILDAGIAIT